MGIFIFLTAVLVEVIFAVYCVITKSNQQRIRSIIRVTALVGFITLVLLGVVNWGLRYYAIAALLLLYTVMGVVTLARKRKGEREYRTLLVVLKAVGMTLSIFVAVVPAILFPEYKEIPVTGKYEVETAFYTYTDKSRIETYANTAENRKLNVQMWYPQNAEGKYPLVVFSHGSFGIKSSNESLYKELASHGYVVCSIDHTYQCFYTTDMYGHTVYMDKEYMEEIKEENPRVDIQKSYEYYKKWMNIRTGDINYVLDYILLEAKNNNADKAYKLVDTERIGVMGHSLGGSAALGIGRMRNDVSAVIALEAPFMNDIKGVKDGKFTFTDEKYPVPVLNVYSDASYTHLGEWVQYAENYALLSNNNAATFNAYIKGAGHLGLTDFSLTSPLLQHMIDKASGAKSTIDSVYCLKTINKLSLEFLDCYLKEQGKFVTQGTY